MGNHFANHQTLAKTKAITINSSSKTKSPITSISTPLDISLSTIPTSLKVEKGQSMNLSKWFYQSIKDLQRTSIYLATLIESSKDWTLFVINDTPWRVNSIQKMKTFWWTLLVQLLTCKIYQITSLSRTLSKKLIFLSEEDITETKVWQSRMILNTKTFLRKLVGQLIQKHMRISTSKCNITLNNMEFPGKLIFWSTKTQLSWSSKLSQILGICKGMIFHILISLHRSIAKGSSFRRTPGFCKLLQIQE